ncbi:MAG TPA: formylglycine-generating enzyme family protein [Verrucomicrobiae bacterium]|nr:formylglycine-generating enzyme family protein [Verrucomicrobiae bacterium]
MNGIVPFRIAWICLAVGVWGAGCAPTPVQQTGRPAFRPEIRTNGVGMELIRLPAGEFVMGSPGSEPNRSADEIQHRVKITQSFWMSATPVTVGQFAEFARATGYRTAAERDGFSFGIWNLQKKEWNRIDGGSWKNPGFPQDDRHPVVAVTWNDASAFCDWLGAREHRKYRLPTEAEWEYACRAGGTTAYPWGNNPDDGKGWANCNDIGSKEEFNLFPAFNWPDGWHYTSPVGSYRPNAWGLYDMIGNVLQWCSDWYGEYPAGLAVDPRGPADGKERILRGGAFVYGPRHCRCAFRGRNQPDFRNYYIGFRVVADDDLIK